MGKDHKKSRKEKKHVYVSSESDPCSSESDSCYSDYSESCQSESDTKSDVGYHSEDDSIVSEEVPEEEESPVCKITNEDIAQAFALFDLRLRQICKKVGVSGVYDEDSTNETEKSVDEETSGSIQPLMFPQIPMTKSESGDPRLPNALKHLKFGKL